MGRRKEYLGIDKGIEVLMIRKLFNRFCMEIYDEK